MAYATGPELQEYMGGASLPSDFNRLLERASDLVDYVTFGKLDPDNDKHMEVAKKATCAQAEYMIKVGEDSDISGSTYDSLSIGTYQYTKSSSSSSSTKSKGGRDESAMAPRARRILFLAGFSYRGVRMI